MGRPLFLTSPKKLKVPSSFSLISISALGKLDKVGLLDNTGSPSILALGPTDVPAICDRWTACNNADRVLGKLVLDESSDVHVASAVVGRFPSCPCIIHGVLT